MPDFKVWCQDFKESENDSTTIHASNHDSAAIHYVQNIYARSKQTYNNISVMSEDGETKVFSVTERVSYVAIEQTD